MEWFYVAIRKEQFKMRRNKKKKTKFNESVENQAKHHKKFDIQSQNEWQSPKHFLSISELVMKHDTRKKIIMKKPEKEWNSHRSCSAYRISCVA